jgi:hypothetical protein
MARGKAAAGLIFGPKDRLSAFDYRRLVIDMRRKIGRDYFQTCLVLSLWPISEKESHV